MHVEQQLAEKIHAYTHDYGDQDNGRAKDLYDMLAITQHLPLPSVGTLRHACHQTFTMRDTPWPPALQPPPHLSAKPWRAFVRDYSIAQTSLKAAYEALNQFWRPTFEAPDDTHDHLQWHADTWEWR